MAKTQLDKANTVWIEVDISSLDKAGKALHAKMKASQAQAKADREAFENWSTARLVKKGHIEEGQAPFYAHNFGKFSMAADREGNLYVKDAPKAATAKGKPGKFSL
jgi:hypothetical protein